MPFFSGFAKSSILNSWKATPNSINNLMVWYDASYSQGSLDSSNLPISANDTKVATFVDRSGLGRNSAQSNTQKQPTWKNGASGINGLPAYYFSNSGMVTATSLSLGVFTIFSIFKLTGSGIIYEHGPAAWQGGGCYLHGTIGASIDVNRSSAPSEKDYTSNWALGNVTKLACHRFNGTHATHTLKINGSDVSLTTFSSASNNPGTSLYTNTFNIGSRNGVASLPITGLLGEFLIYNRYLSDDEVVFVEKYLKSKWGII